MSLAGAGAWCLLTKVLVGRPRPPAGDWLGAFDGWSYPSQHAAQALARGMLALEIADKVRGAIETEIGKIARPRNVWIVAYMPKTRSGKIMRRVIAAVSNFADVGDTTTLAAARLHRHQRWQGAAEEAAVLGLPPGVQDDRLALAGLAPQAGREKV